MRRASWEKYQMSFRLKTIAVLSATLISISSFAETIDEHEEYVVTASKIPTPKHQVSSKVTIIDAEDIRLKQFRTVIDALQTVPSLSVIRSGGAGKSTAVFSRGSNANHTLVRLDDIEINDPSAGGDGRMDFSNLLISDIERIEVLHGPQGMLYGSDAIGAVISIYTKKGTEKTAVNASIEGGSDNTFNQYLSASGSNSGFDARFNIQHFDTDGISATTNEFVPAGSSLEDDGHENTTISANIGYTPNDVFDTRISVRHIATRDELDLNVFPIQADNDSRSESEVWNLGSRTRLNLFDGFSEHILNVSYIQNDLISKDDTDPINPLDFLRNKNLGKKNKIELQNNFFVTEDNTVTVGFESEEEKVFTSLVSTSAFGPFSSSVEAHARNNALYVQDQYGFFGRLYGTIGFRLDEHERFGKKITYRIAPAYLLKETNTKFKASYATGFKAPSPFQLFGTSISGFGVFNGNPDLRPEESKGWEIGVEQNLFNNRVSAEVTYYNNDIKNLIQGGATTNTNVGVAVTRGLEFDMSVDVTESLSAQLGYAFTRAFNKISNADLLRRPKHKGNLNLTYKMNDKTSFSSQLTHIGTRADIDAATFATIKSSSYTLVNMQANYQYNEYVGFFGRLENLLDKDYEEPNGFSQPGLSAFVGINLSLNP